MWTKYIIKRYEKRPASLEQVHLAEFASWYAEDNDFVDEDNDVHVDGEEDLESEPIAKMSSAQNQYRKRLMCSDITTWTKPSILNEKWFYYTYNSATKCLKLLIKIKFLQLFDDNKDAIMERRSQFESKLNMQNLMR